MKTQTPKWAIWARSLLVLPVTAFLLYGFSTKEVVERVVQDHSQSEKVELQEKATPEMIEEYNKLAKYYNARPDSLEEKENGDAVKLNRIYKLMTPEQRQKAEPFPSHMEIIQVVEDVQPSEKEELEEYNKLARYYNSLPEDQVVIRMKDLERMRYLYNQMTEEQKKKAEPLPAVYPPPPPPPPAPPTDFVHPEVPTPPAPPAHRHPDIKIPAPPPTPPAPAEHIKELAAKGARFFLHDEREISAEQALKLVKNNKNISIRVTDYNSETTVHIKTGREK